MDMFRNIDRASYHRQVKALEELHAEAIARLAVEAPGHGPWWTGTTSGFWRREPGRDQVPGRQQVIRCERCKTAGAELSVFGAGSDGREIRTWNLDAPCKA